MTKLPATPYFKELTTDELRSELRSWQNLSYTWGQMACSASPASRTGRQIAQGWGRCERNVDLIINILGKRGA